MIVRDILSYAAGALSSHRQRAAMCLTGMSIGTAAIVILVSLGESASVYVTDQFASIGARLLIVVPGKTETTGGLPGFGGVPNPLTLDDAMALAESLPARRVVPVSMATASVSFGERRRQVAILGTTRDSQATRQLRLAAGRFIPGGDWKRGTSVAVIGSRVAQELFPGTSVTTPLGKTIRIDQYRLRVVGILAPRGVQLGADMDEVVVVPVSTAMRIFNRRSLFRILIEPEESVSVSDLSAGALALLTDRHGEEDVTAMTANSVKASFDDIIRALTLALAGIASVSLVVAGIGIMNVMLVSISERQSEVGLLKALGATNRQVRGLFLVESLMLSSLGAVAGLSLALVGLWLVDIWVVTGVSLVTPSWAAGVALAVPLVVGTASGVVPAWRASAVHPTDVLMRD